jgi:hypothetical protein
MNEPHDDVRAGGAGGLQELVAQRREALASQPPPDRTDLPSPGLDDPVWGLALSGGGIRSATFCLGLVSGLAQRGIFSRFDVLSTVSGGGYAGSAVGKLFTQASSARGVEARLGAMTATWFVWWLRATSRYLTPRGAKDMLLAAAVYLRNLFAIHLELGLAAIAVGAFLALVDLAIWRSLLAWFESTPALLDVAAVALQSWMSGWWLAIVIPIGMGIALVSAYWTVTSKPDFWRSVMEGVLLLALIAGGAVGLWTTIHWEEFFASQVDGPLRVTCGIVSALFLCAAPGAPIARLVRPGDETDSEAAAAVQRNRLTKYLAALLQVGVVLLLLGLLDRAAWFVAFSRHAYAPLLPLVLAIGLAVARTFAARLPAQDSATAVTGRVGFKLAELTGILLFALLATFWASLVYMVALANLVGPAPGDVLFGVASRSLLPFLLVPLFYMWLTSGNADFSNVSSLHMFYRSRLTRSYLGAANGARFQARPAKGSAAVPAVDPLSDVSARDIAATANRRSVFEVDPGDNVRLHDYEPHRSGGPVHILNVTINQTYDAFGGLFNQDRKGEYLSITTGGRYRIGLQDWTQDSSFAESDLPTWMAISGAAFAPGLGGQTSGGMAILLFMAGVRLGYWWDMGKSRGNLSWSKYKLLGGEARAKFGGTDARFWYLSDGGHFENTGAYALLRERAEMIVLADAAADPEYAFEDLENLVRKARIDLRTEIVFIDFSANAGHMSRYFGSREQLSDQHSDACIALARIEYPSGPPGWLVYVKPNMFRGLPVDLINYRRDNPQFPQESTTDQFFSESQWESYFRLGRELGLQLDGKTLATIAAGQAVLPPKPTPTALAAGSHEATTQGKKKTLLDKAFTTPVSVRTVNLAKSGLSLTALVAVLTAATQTWEKFSEDRQSQRHAYVADVNSALAVAEKFRRGDTSALPDLTSKLAAIANTYCHDRVSDVPVSPVAVAMHREVSEQCRPVITADQGRLTSEERKLSPACEVLTSLDVTLCMAGNKINPDRPVYWAIDYSDPVRSRQRIEDVLKPVVKTAAGAASAAAPAGQPAAASASAASVAATAAAAPAASGAATAAAAPAAPTAVTAVTASAAPDVRVATVPSAAAPAARTARAAAVPAGTGSSCAGKVIYRQIYSSSEAAVQEAETWADVLLKKGARVPPVEDVVATATRQGKQPPRPVSAPTAIYHTDDDHRCASELMNVNPAVVPRPVELPSLAGVIELWLPPGNVAARPAAAKK